MCLAKYRRKQAIAQKLKREPTQQNLTSEKPIMREEEYDGVINSQTQFAQIAAYHTNSRGKLQSPTTPNDVSAEKQLKPGKQPSLNLINMKRPTCKHRPN